MDIVRKIGAEAGRGDLGVERCGRGEDVLDRLRDRSETARLVCWREDWKYLSLDLVRQGDRGHLQETRRSAASRRRAGSGRSVIGVEDARAPEAGG
jgi:hypothetical protein